MCGRFACNSTEDTIVNEFNIFEVHKRPVPNYNVAPGQEVLGVMRNGNNKLVGLRWGLIPSWAKEPEIGYRMINARAETLTQKPSFAKPLKSQRCLIVADGFYEWRKEMGKKIPLFVHLKSNKPFGFAGLYDIWQSPDGEEINSCTIITTSANELIMPIHNRMPVILRPDARDIWLDRNIEDTVKLLPLLKPYEASELELYEVSPLVNSVKNNNPDLIKPIPK